MEFPECFDKGLFRNFLKVGKSKNPLEPLLEIFIELHPEDAARAFESLNAEQELHLFHHSVELHCRLPLRERARHPTTLFRGAKGDNLCLFAASTDIIKVAY